MTMTAEQLAVVAKAARFLRANASSLRADREGAGSIRAALEMLEADGLADPLLDACTMIRASIKAYDQGNDRSAASHADTAADRLETVIADARQGAAA